VVRVDGLDALVDSLQGDPISGSCRDQAHGFGVKLCRGIRSIPGEEGDLAMHMRLTRARVVLVATAVALVAAGAALASGALQAGKVTKVGFASPAKASD
jgi:hypothetical protein